MKYLLDTNIISETTKPKPNNNVIRWLETIPQDEIFISALTIGEIRKGIENLPSGKKKNKLLLWLETELIVWFDGHIVTIDTEVADKWGYLLSQSARTLPAIDSLIAATAITHNFMLVTRNADDFKDIANLEIFNPWEI